MSVFQEPEQPGSVPATRSLPLVLRRLLDVGGVSLLVGKVMAVPDSKHVDVEVAGQRVIIPGLAGYVPVVGEGCWCLVGNSVVLAIGSASGTRPTTVPAGTAEGQVLVWNATLGAWQGRAAAPAATNADLLDSIDSTGFLLRQVAGTDRAWWTLASGSTDASGLLMTAHPLGRVPAFVSALANLSGVNNPRVAGVNVTTSNVFTYWTLPNGAAAASVAVAAYIMVVG
jgi:hypothetical protein